MYKNIIKGLVGLLAVSLLAGCANKDAFSREAICVTTGALIGGGAGATNDTDDAVAGTIGGALIGALVCHVMDGDTDGDGIKDSADQCPATPMGKAVDENGCTLDKDEDGVVNANDECPYTPAGQTVDAQGCSAKEEMAETKSMDDDKDGVHNDVDECPDTPLGAKVDAKGCPKVLKVTLRGVTFKHNSAELTDDAKGLLTEQARVLTENPLLRVKVTGHTDDSGVAAYNDALSLDRATSVKKFLASQGIDESIFKVEGAGESQPVADNATAAGRAENRRVELDIISK